MNEYVNNAPCPNCGGFCYGACERSEAGHEDEDVFDPMLCGECIRGGDEISGRIECSYYKFTQKPRKRKCKGFKQVPWDRVYKTWEAEYYNELSRG